MTERPWIQSLGTGLLLLTLLMAESLFGPGGAPHALTLLLAELGFALFAARALLRTRPLGPWVEARPRIVRVAGILLFTLLVLAQAFWAAAALVAALLFFGGILAVEFLDDVARVCARPPRIAARRPLAFGLAFLGVLLVLTLFHEIMARGLYLSRGDTPVSLAFGTATFGLFAAILLVAGLLVAGWRGVGRERVPARALYVVAFLYLTAWLFGYADADALGTLGEATVPLLAVGIAVVEFAEILFEAPERMARRALPREALWDLFLALSFAAILVLTTFGIGGATPVDALFGAKALSWLGFAAGALLVPLARWRAARSRDAALPVPEGAAADA